MSDEKDNKDDSDDRPHRGRVQAQGGGTEESEPWAAKTPMTETEVLRLVDQLEAKLKPRERRDRAEPFAAVRKYITNAARSGGIWADPKPHKKSFPKRGSADIRVDLEVQKGGACVPDETTES